MYKIGLVDVDGHNFPNLALMKISAFHKQQGDNVEWCWTPLQAFDRVYQSKVFDDTYSRDIDWMPTADEIIKGGTGYSMQTVLPHEIEHIYPDYDLYGENRAIGYLTRGCPRGCDFCIVSAKEGRRSRKVADLSEFWRGQKEILLLDPNLLACKDREELLDQLIESKAYVDFSQGLDIRLTDDVVADKLSQMRVKCLHFAWDDPRQDLRPYFKKFGDRYQRKNHRTKIVYVLTNYNTTIEEDLFRVYELRALGYDPDVRVYDKPNAPKEIKRLQRWVNNRRIFKSCEWFEDYKG